MVRKRAEKRLSGVLKGFTRRLNPLTTRVYALVTVDERTIKVPIDCRQIKFVVSENAIDSVVNLEFYDSEWHIKSQQTMEENFYLLPDTPTMPWLEKDIQSLQQK